MHPNCDAIRKSNRSTWARSVRFHFERWCGVANSIREKKPLKWDPHKVAHNVKKVKMQRMAAIFRYSFYPNALLGIKLFRRWTIFYSTIDIKKTERSLQIIEWAKTYTYFFAGIIAVIMAICWLCSNLRAKFFIHFVWSCGM